MDSSLTSPKTIKSVDNKELYERWAYTYDTDANILQQIDDLLIEGLLQEGLIFSRPSMTATITELGCGTGRNTYKLMTQHSNWPTITHVNALDLSPAMIKVAQDKCNKLCGQGSPTLAFYLFDALAPMAARPPIELVDMVVSTLVLEHLPIDIFFATLKLFLKPGGAAVVTNMHSEMGVISRAGFNDQESGVKVRGTSYAHTVDEVMEGARKAGFMPYGDMQERAITENDLKNGVVGSRGKKWLGIKVWYGGVFELAKQGES